MNQQELILRDIHLPAPVSWWPPAPGWWLIAATVVAIVMLSWWWRRRSIRLRNAPATLARRELETLQAAWNEHRNESRLLRETSVWLRRTGMSLTSRQEAASLTGRRWQQYLDDLAGEAIFSDADVRLITEASYRPAPLTAEADSDAMIRANAGTDGNTIAGAISDIDGNHLLRQCERWLSAATRRTKTR
jgi:hypothetical protein